MRIGVLTVGDPTKTQTWSGTPAHICQALRDLGADVVPIGPLHSRSTTAFTNAVRVRNRLLPGQHAVDRDPWLLKQLSQAAGRALAEAAPLSFVLALGGLPLAHSKLSSPTALWADATVRSMLGYHEYFSHWTRRSRISAERAEARALRNADVFFGASDWVCSSVIGDYGVSPANVALVPFGANLAEAPVDRRREQPGAEVRLLSVGAPWEQKGLDVACETASELRAQGRAVSLDVVGAPAPSGSRFPSYVRLHGFLSKDVPAERARLDQLYRDADVFLLPTRAECFGVVFSEAAAYGLPVIAPRTGGVPTAVRDGVTGILVEAGSTAAAYAAAVLSAIGDPYVAMARASRIRYETELNWGSACAAIVAEMGSRFPRGGEIAPSRATRS